MGECCNNFARKTVGSEQKKDWLLSNQSLVGVDGFEPPTLCL